MDTAFMSAPFHINWNFTYSCNFNCSHCYSRTRSGGDELDVQGKLKVASNIIESNVFSVNLGGGEPLLCPDLFPVMDVLAQEHIKVSLSTNGFGISQGQIEELKGAGLSQAILSLDSATAPVHDKLRRQEGCFDACVACAKDFVKAEIPVVFSVVLTRENFGELESIMTLAQKVGASGVEFKRLRLYGNAANLEDRCLNSKQEQSLYATIKQVKSQHSLPLNLVYGTRRIEGVDDGCPCAKTALSILADGTIAACVYNPFSLGNALTESIATIWQSSPELIKQRATGKCLGSKEER